MVRKTIALAVALAVIAVIPATGLAVQGSSATPKLAAKLRALSGKVAQAWGTIGTLRSVDAGVENGVKTLSGQIATLGSEITTLQGNVTSINSQLAAGAAALTAINSALTNSTTGLVGLNHARTQFGAFNSAGVIQGGTGQVAGASGPSANAVGTHAIAGQYVIDFGNDVSSRFLVANPFLGGSAAGVPQATDCAATGVATFCGNAEGGAADSSPNHVLVAFGGGGTNPVGGFEVAAISG